MANNATSRVSNNGNRRSTANSRNNVGRAQTRRMWERYYINLVRIGAPLYMIRWARDILEMLR